ncbi:MAG TPA: L,D-transpeptidase family protein [Thermoanaerobaculia bacterium]|nr:L,D-transpeptidase family protein [Thermoanaerobaculia bacterium]
MATERSRSNALPMLFALLLVTAIGLVVIRQSEAAGIHADRILVEKKAHRLTLLKAGQSIRTYRVALGGRPVGDKECQGDHRTPEGLFTIDNRLPQSRFHRALHVSYPDATHRKKSRQRGCDPGGDIMIHGLKNGMGWLGPLHRMVNWTDGCIAVTDGEIEEIYDAVPLGTPVEIRP